MRMTSHSDYALRVLLYLGLNTDRLVTAEEISDRYQISKNHLMKVILELRQNGYIETVRGRNGGLRLARPADKISIGSVVRALEDDFAVVECLGSQNTCVIADACRLTGIMRRALSAWFNVLDQYTLADLLKRPAPMRKLLSAHAG